MRISDLSSKSGNLPTVDVGGKGSGGLVHLYPSPSLLTFTEESRTLPIMTSSEVSGRPPSLVTSTSSTSHIHMGNRWRDSITSSITISHGSHRFILLIIELQSREEDTRTGVGSPLVFPSPRKGKMSPSLLSSRY